MTRPPAVVIAAPDGPIAITPEQVDALQARGHLFSAGPLVPPRTDLDRAGVLEFLIAHPELGSCDFCGRRGVSWDFPARDHDTTAGERSVGAWSACDDCAKLIRAGRRAELAREAARRMGRPVRNIRRTHDLFWANREGPGGRIENDCVQ